MNQNMSPKSHLCVKRGISLFILLGEIWVRALPKSLKSMASLCLGSLFSEEAIVP